MDAPPPIIIGLEGLIQHSLPRITRFRSAAAAMTNFGRLSPFLKRLQVSILLLGSIYRKFSQYDMIAGSDLCLGICHDSLVQTQGMIEAVLQAPEGDNVYNLGAEVLIERLPDEISSFISSVELLRSTYQESQSEYILGSMKELANLRRDYSKHLQECTHNRKKGSRLAVMTGSSEDERTSRSDNGTQLTEPEASLSGKSSRQRLVEEKSSLAANTATIKQKLGHTATLGARRKA
ncbi:hypothetical protein M441DRAFT_152314 [Trichoderma asperellum CBS 433.97]|uniref:Uncharacterized protein n=1 Tax=Trichoderma asperellum (strain ATCC 204424 / CBS 433.97 / NBRC 101777) TaxID=1042311 RepID=A0A2T3YTE3_TRIA4|nr:hypothetical protein M441DRAFT_152314 [Trichoderma asperellum CBS 433.97]PTB35838.1 hypothetical protein M441DRAFT_152314 [Trichoderma asperellum CBS 433.97]